MERHTLAKYLMELTLLDYHMVHYRPSEIAAASLCLSQLLLEGLPWVSLLKRLHLLNSLMLLQLDSVSSVSSAAALLGLRRGPPEAHRAAHCQKRGDGDRGAKQVHGEFGASAPVVGWKDETETFAPLQAVKNKYASSKLLKISLIPQLKSTIVKNMAAPLLSS